jgi:hypothetical protein
LTKLQQYLTTPVLIFATAVLSILAWVVIAISDNSHLEAGLKFASDKGIDPMAVRCVYSSSYRLDSLCVIYLTHYKSKDPDISVPVITKK